MINNLPYTNQASNVDKNTLFFIMSALLAPFAEEIFFRGWLLSILEKKINKYISVLIVAAIFAAYHSYGISIGSFVLFILGCLWGYAVLKTGSIFSSVLTHLAYNIFILIITETSLVMRLYSLFENSIAILYISFVCLFIAMTMTLMKFNKYNAAKIV